MGNSVSVGIDLGTTNTLVCMEHRGKPRCLRFRDNGNGSMLPSVLYYENGSTSIGEVANGRGVTNPHNEIRSSKTFMGSKKTWIIDGKTFTPTDVATEILSEVKKVVCETVKDNDVVIDATITVPADFNSIQLQETKKAGQRAGLNVKKIITEPMAAAIAYISEMDSDDDEELLLVMDLGGGTFDLSLLQYNCLTDNYDAKFLEGDKHLGGDDFDKLLLKEFKDYIYNETGLDLTNYESSGLSYSSYNSTIGRLRKSAEEAKIALSSSNECSVTIPTLCKYNGRDYDFSVELSREEFDNICKPLYDRIFNLVDAFIKSNHIDINKVWRVALVGGSCNIPYIKEKADTLFSGKVFSDLDLSTLVVKGAYTVASSMNGVDVSNHYSDILSHALGIEVQGGFFSELLPRYNKYPCKYTKTFSTVRDYQKNVVIKIYESKDIGMEDKNLVKNCTFYGSFVLENIEKAKRGVPKIDVTFEFDDSRLLTVTAVDKTTKAKKKVVIKSALDTSPDEFDNDVAPMDIYLLIDASGSMRSGKIAQTKVASHKLISDLIDLKVHRLGVVSFGDDVVFECGLTQNDARLNSAVEKITPYGGTDLANAIRDVTTDLLKYKNEKCMIILTDGHPNSDSATEKQAIISKDSGIKIISIGVGLDSRAKQLLAKVSSTREDGSNYVYLIDNINGLSEIFEQISGELALR